MTQVARPPSQDHFWEGGWHYDVDDLALAGVTLTNDQYDLLLPFSDGELVVVAMPLPSPDEIYMATDMAWATPLEVRNSPREAPSRVTAPFLAEVRWDACEVLDERVGPLWRRFPSLPVQAIYPDVDFWPVNFAEDEFRYVRIWNAMACPGEISNAMLYFGHHLGSSWNGYTKLGLFWASLFNVIDDCELAHMYDGIAAEHHRHLEVPAPYALFDIKCLDGEEVFNRLEHELFVSGHRGSDVKPFPLPEMDIELAIAWHRLERSGRRAGQQAMQVAPSQAAELRHEEREGGCPWE